ncbi:hypothetical protein [Seonamhaeicola sp.]|uniref:hypothetical protein n=1 Tax=Seonamhaeicola sp. TaxID=1912245 RepID=UPI00260265DC|nr:hypothetical protein [Seonamhaeicola sp.]
MTCIATITLAVFHFITIPAIDLENIVSGRTGYTALVDISIYVPTDFLIVKNKNVKLFESTIQVATCQLVEVNHKINLI